MADYWLKLYIEILDDPKMATLPDRVWRRIVELFLVAKKLNKDGHLPDTRQIAWMLRMAQEELEHDMTQIASTGIIVQEVGGWYIPKFAKRQQAATGAERIAEFRERQHKQEYYGDVTEEKRIVTQSTEDRRQKQRTETEAEEPAAPFDTIQRTVESKGIVLSGKADIDAVIELVTMGATSEDVMAAIDWKSKNNRGKPVRYVSQLVGPAKTAIAKRLQQHVPKPDTFVPSEVY